MDTTETMVVTAEPGHGVKRPVDGQTETDEEPPTKVARSNTNSVKNLFKQLSLMRKGLYFELEGGKEASVKPEEGAAQTYTMVVDVDGVKFRGTGPSKRNAKVLAAEQVLAHLESLGVKPREPTETKKKSKAPAKPNQETPPTSEPLTEEQKTQQMTGENPVEQIRPNMDTTETMEVKAEAGHGVKRPAEDSAETEEEPPVKVARPNTNSFKNVFKQLSLMRPGLYFEMEVDEEQSAEEGATQTYTMVVEVDGVKFRGTGPSKRNAKVVAAEQVLAHLESLGVKPRELTEAEKQSKAPADPKPKPEAPPAAQPLSEEQKALQMTGKNPVMMLHEIRPNFECAIESDERRGAHRKVVMSVTVEGQKFIGAGRSNKNARARAAVAALESLFGLTFTEFGENEIPVYLGDEWAWRKYTKRAEKVTQPPVAGKPVKNAVMQLNDMYKGLEFNVVDRTGPDHCPYFKVSVDIEGQKFEGAGSTKKAAKLNAAEKALDGLALSGVLAQRATQKKQHKWGQQQQKTWNNDPKKKGPPLAQSFIPASQNENGGMKAGRGGGQTGGANSWSNSWMGQDGSAEQNGQTGMRGRGRGMRGGTRGTGQGRGGMRGGGMRGGGMQGGSGGGRGMRGSGGGQMRGGRGGQARGRGLGSSTWGRGGQNQSDMTSLSGGMGRGRNSSSMLPPSGSGSVRGSRGGRGRGMRGASSQSSTGWGSQTSLSSTGGDYSYQDPYTADSSSTWNSQSYGYDTSYNNSYDNSSYDTSYDKSYDSTYDNSTYNNAYQGGDTSSWGDYYGY